jgi:hypothetical protein
MRFAHRFISRSKTEWLWLLDLLEFLANYARTRERIRDFAFIRPTLAQCLPAVRCLVSDNK